MTGNMHTHISYCFSRTSRFIMMHVWMWALWVLALFLLNLAHHISLQDCASQLLWCDTCFCPSIGLFRTMYTHCIITDRMHGSFSADNTVCTPYKHINILAFWPYSRIISRVVQDRRWDFRVFTYIPYRPHYTVHGKIWPFQHWFVGGHFVALEELLELFIITTVY